eukprot:SAG25_NODE_2600_length_1500_cov_2.452534_1_plen_367_part_00
MPRPTPSTLGQELLGDQTPVTDSTYAEPRAAVGSSVALGAALRPVIAAIAADLSNMQIFVKSSTGKCIMLGQVRGSDKVSSIKTRIQDSEGIPLGQQNLFSGAERLEDWQTLGDCGVGREAVLRLLLAGDTLPAAPSSLNARRGGALALCAVVGVLLLFAVFHSGACDGSPYCGAHGTCIASGGSHSCTCEDGWGGDACEQEPSPCDSSPCDAHGSCVAQSGGYSLDTAESGGTYQCACASGWTGAHCETPAVPSSAVLLVAGAGSANYNGFYRLDGVASDNPQYCKINDCNNYKLTDISSFHCASGAPVYCPRVSWILHPDAGPYRCGYTSAYFNCADQSSPPTSGWHNNGGTTGTLPLPTLTWL